MKYEDYIKKLAELKAQLERAIVAKLPALERQAYQLLVSFIDQNLDVKDGQFLANDKAVQALNNFSDIYLGALTELSDYKGSIGQYLKNFKDLSTLMQEFQTKQGIDVKKAQLGAVQEIVVNEVVNQYSANGLNPGFVQPLRQLLFNNVTGGMNKVEAMGQLRDYIASGKDTTGKLGRYIEQTAQHGVDSYTGAINTRIMQSFTINTMIMSGSLIETSSPQCRFAIEEKGGIIDRADWPAIEKIAREYGLIEGTTFENLPFNKLHWGCRHEFTPVVLTAAQRNQLLSNPVNN